MEEITGSAVIDIEVEAEVQDGKPTMVSSYKVITGSGHQFCYKTANGTMHNFSKYRKW